MDVVMGIDTHPYEEEVFRKNEIFCEPNFGPHHCNGLNGVFGSDFQSATTSKDGLWRLWLWMPEYSHKSEFGYDLEQGDEVAVWVGTYVDTDSGTMFDTGYWQYGQMMTMTKANYLYAGSVIALFGSLLF